MTTWLLALACLAASAPQASPLPPVELPQLTDEQVETISDAYGRAWTRDEDLSRAERLKALRTALAICPNNSEAWYDVACYEALDGRKAEAWEALEQAGRRGWTRADHAEKDSDLASLREDPRFAAWLERVRGNEATLNTWPTIPSERATLDPSTIEPTRKRFLDELDRLNPVMGSIVLREAVVVRAWGAASWDAIGAARPPGPGRAEAALEALRVVVGSDVFRRGMAETPEIQRRAERLLAEHPRAEWTPEVKLRLAEARYLNDWRATGDPTATEGPSRRFVRDVLALVAVHERGSAVDEALVRLIGWLHDDFETARGLHERLMANTADRERALRLLHEDPAASSMHWRIVGLPPFEARTLDGKVVTRESLKGRVTLIDFWATWCGPCLAELPAIREAHDRWHSDGFDVLGISLDEENGKGSAPFVKWCKDKGLPWPQVWDGKGFEGPLAELFRVNSIPRTFLVDREGRIVATRMDYSGKETLVDVVGRHVRPAPTP